MASQASIQNSAGNAMEKIIHHILLEANVAELAKVVKYDKKKHIADLLPLTNLPNGEPSAQLLDVPVVKSCYQLDELIEKIKPDFKDVDKFETEKGKKIGSSFVKKLPKKVMKKNAVVIVLFLNRDMDKWRGGTTTFTPETNRLHDINDGIVIGVVK